MVAEAAEAVVEMRQTVVADLLEVEVTQIVVVGTSPSVESYFEKLGPL